MDRGLPLAMPLFSLKEADKSPFIKTEAVGALYKSITHPRILAQHHFFLKKVHTYSIL